MFDQVLTGSHVHMDTCVYIRRFTFLVYFINKKKRAEIMLKGNAVTSSEIRISACC